MTKRSGVPNKQVVLRLFFCVPFFLCVFASGCTTLSNLPGSPSAKTFTMPASFEEAWRASLMTLIAEYIPIETQDEEGGTVKTSEFKIQPNEFQKWAHKAFVSSDGYGQARLRLLSIDRERTRLEIAAQFRGESTSMVPATGRYYESTGAFESQLAARIHEYVILTKYPKLLQLVTGCNFRWNEQIEHYEISGVEPGSFGEAQGFQNGDIVIQLDGINMTMENFFATLVSIEQTETKTFFLDRGGKGVLLEATIFYLPNDLPWFGFHVGRDIETGRFQVTDIIEDSPAEDAGLMVGDLLLQEEEIPLAGWYEYYRAMSGARVGVERNFLIWRDGSERWLTMRAEPPRS